MALRVPYAVLVVLSPVIFVTQAAADPPTSKRTDSRVEVLTSQVRRLPAEPSSPLPNPWQPRRACTDSRGPRAGGKVHLRVHPAFTRTAHLVSLQSACHPVILAGSLLPESDRIAIPARRPVQSVQPPHLPPQMLLLVPLF